MILPSFSDPSLWTALGSVIFTNILLSGDNALIIGLATRNLPQSQQKNAIFWGIALAIIMRIVIIFTTVHFLAMPYIKIIGAALLVFIGIHLLYDDDIVKRRQRHSRIWGAIRKFVVSKGGDEDVFKIRAHSNIWGAIRTIIIADFIMSLDNIVAVSAAAHKGPENARLAILFVGLGLSIPLIIFGSTMISKTMKRFPNIIFLGAGFLGFLAGGLLVEDPAIKNFIGDDDDNAMKTARVIFEAIGIAAVLLVGTILRKI